ncbi:unnamed protein product, partial [Mesorhabditis belari]|uniref:HEAT repeat-containing protein 5B n=1 Tax=Mesorhabditis belari TaxID=2138241 RepID=A0AAF3FR50_9BILA
MEASHSLLLNEEALQSCSEPSRPLFIYEWLRYLDKILPVTHNNELKAIQPRLIEQLHQRLLGGVGPPTRMLLAKCISKTYDIGDMYSVSKTINLCSDILESKDESTNQLSIKLSALCTLGSLFENLKRIALGSHEILFNVMSKWLTRAESQVRGEIMSTMAKMAKGLGSGGSKIHKDMYKLAKKYAEDRVMVVRNASLQCLLALVPAHVPIFTTDLEATITLCTKALDNSNYECRISVAKLLAVVLSNAHQPPPNCMMPGKSVPPIPVKPLPAGECLQLISIAFLKGGIGGWKSGSNSAMAGGQREVRIGAVMAYVEWVREMGALWLERNLALFLRHSLDLAAKCGPLAYTSSSTQQIEAVQLRRCVSFILRETVGRMLSENVQLTACKYLGQLLAEYINSLDYSDPTVDRVLSAEDYSSCFAAEVALLELSCLVRQISTQVTPLFIEASGIMEPVFACLLHPLKAVRIATSWCLRCVTLAVPSLLTPLIDRCISRLEHMKSSSDALSGYSLALSALIAASADCNLGIPSVKYSQVLNVAEDMLRTASQQSRLAVARIEAGWLLIHASTVLGVNVMKSQMGRVVALWKAAFPRSVKEAETEKTRGDAFSWQCTLESRVGALAAMCAVASHPELLDEQEIKKSMLLPIETTLILMSSVGVLIKNFGVRMRPLVAMIRVRLYTLLGHLNTKCYENLFAPLLRELVADLTLSDNAQATHSTSLAISLCTGAETTLLAPWHDLNDQSMLENTLSAAHNGAVGSPEFESTSIVTTSATTQSTFWPEPLPAEVRCIDMAVTIYGRLFPFISRKHQVQITEHFASVIKEQKNPNRQSVIQMNALCAIVSALRSISENKGSKVEQESLAKTIFDFVKNGITSSSVTIRCVSAETLGRLAQTVGDAQYVASVAQFCFGKLEAARDVQNRTGYALALGCLHKHVGSLGSPHHLKTGVEICLALAQESSSPIVQAWALVALSLIAETGGGMFRGFVDSVLSVCLRLLLNTSSSNTEVVLCIGKLLSALITCVGPELGLPGSIETTRISLLSACALQFAFPCPLVKAEAIQGLQQMHLFAPRYVNLRHLVIDIASLLSCYDLCLRRAAVCCLRQLVQREAREVREHAQVLVPQGVVDEGKKLPLPDTGLEGALFSMLDVEIDALLRSHVEETLTSLVQATSGELLSNWLLLCKELLASSASDTTRSTLIVEEPKDEDKEDDEEGADDVTLAGPKGAVAEKGKVMPRWPTRVFVTQIVQRLMTVCDSERAHLDLALAKELQISSHGRGDYLVLHLSDLVRMSFMGATSENTELRLAGLFSLQDVITRFSAVPEPEFPGHVILEQFQAQVGAALRPAFTEDTPAHVTAAACQVCSTWIGSGVARDLNDLRRVHQLLVSSLGKLRHGSINTQLYSESAATLEKLSILKAWAEIYVTAIEQERTPAARKEDDIYPSGSNESLLSLVQPELESLVGYWLAALRDSALLALPSQFSEQLPTDGGAFYQADSIDASRDYYKQSWPPVLLASATWLTNNNFEIPSNEEAPKVWPDDLRATRLHVMLGLCIEALSSRTTSIQDDATVQQCVRALNAFFSCEWVQLQLMGDVRIAIEIINVMHRLVLTRDCPLTQQVCIDCAFTILEAAQSAIRVSTQKDIENGNVEPIAADVPETLFAGGDGAAFGETPSGYEKGKGAVPLSNTLSYAFLELCLCVLVRQMPQLNSSAVMKSRSTAPLHQRRFGRLSAESARLVQSAVRLLSQVPSLLHPSALPPTLPVILHLCLGVLRESSRIDESSIVPDLPPGHLTSIATAAIQAIRTLCSSPPTSQAVLSLWLTVVRSGIYSTLLMIEGPEPVDECVVLVAAALLCASVPKAAVLGHSESLQRLCALAKRQLISEHPQVKIRTLQALSSLFGRKDVTAVFARQIGPDIYALIKPYVVGENANKLAQDLSEEQLCVLTEAIKALEIIVGAAHAKSKLSILNVLVQSLCGLIMCTNQEEWRALSSTARKLHEMTLQRLNAIAPLHPVDFKTVLSAHPSLKRRLETALLFQTSRITQTNQMQRQRQAEMAKVNASNGHRRRIDEEILSSFIASLG